MRAPWTHRSLDAGVVFALACAIYLNALGNGFHYDDFHSLVRNPHIRTLEEVPDFFRDSTLFSVNPASAMYRPALLVSYALNFALTGARPAGFRLVNLLLHALNAVLLLRLLRALHQPRALALTAALLFALNPLNSEAVNYISSRSELLMATFFLLSCLAYRRFVETQHRVWYALALAAAAVALLSKSVAAVLVAALALGDGLVEGRGVLRRRWRAYLGFAALAALYLFLVRHFVDRALLTPVRPLAVQLWTQTKALVYYLFLGTMPVHLSAEHQFFTSPHAGEPAVVAALALLAALAGWLAWRGQRRLLFAAAWFLTALLPALVVPLVVLVNEHRLYLAGMGLSLAAAWGLIQLLARRPKVAAGLLAAYTIVSGVLVLERNPVWSDELSLWRDAAARGPLMLRPHLRLADALARRGRLEEAEAAYLRAVALRPRHTAARNNLGLLYMRRGRLEEAEAQFRLLLRSSPDYVPARLNLARLLVERGDWPAAVSEYRRVLEFDPRNGDARVYLGHIALKFQRDPQRALRYYDEALPLVADRRALLVNRGATLKVLQRYSEAEAAYREAVQIDSSLADAWFNLGNLYLEEQRFEVAAAAYERVVGLDADPQLAARAAAQLERLAEWTKQR